MCMRSVGLRHFAVRGDDGIARMTNDQWLQYVETVESLGMSINKSKTFLSNTHGTFCEKFYVLKGSTLVVRPSLSVRIFNPEDKALVIRDMSRTVLDSQLPIERLHRAFSKGASWAFTLARRFKIPMYVPSTYGGMGLPPPSWKWKTHRDETFKIRWAATHGLSFGSQLIVGGRNVRAVASLLQGVVMSISTQNPCYQLPRLTMELLTPAAIADVAEGCRFERKLKPHKFCRELQKKWQSIPLAKGSRDYFYRDLFNHVLLPTQTSLKSALGHMTGPWCEKKPPDHHFYKLASTVHFLSF